jgi:hypothetical protein
MSKKREIFRLIDRHTVSPTAAEEIKKYINSLIDRKGANNGPEAAGTKK